ncbi:amino acid ABC transporter permease [Klugiella xanthotipulae]|uniref:Amino acid ABC transporter membrane protein 2 (PAAT family) n=1 Tax=Klugiella xanthotipulae TaxID=244735 RepID=A0A543I3Z8_9MICO|nr:amino acid ABC transporter permease [Klugiella xanthotipulae]TQM65305.1 amino acid ABC transporter membrane protein 2 (PAAT family) [Klugiella xanthotipulae]
MTSLLFDAPGPRAKRLNVLLNVVVLALVLVALVFVLWQFYQTGQFESRKWSIFTYPLVQQSLLRATVATLQAFAVGAVLSLVLGLLLAIGRMSAHPWVRLPCMWVVELFRATPLLILMMILYYGLPPLGFTFITPFIAVVTALTVYNGAVLAEVFRAGVESLPSGQSEAGYAIGLRKSQVLSLVLMPQAIRAMLPVIIAQLVVILKDSALGFIVTYQELLYEAKRLGTQVQFGSPIIPAAIVVGIIYVGLCLILSGVSTWLERRLRRSPSSLVHKTTQDISQVQL